MIPELKKQAELKMQKALDALANDLAKIRTGRAHTGILDHLKVDYYGSGMPINQVGRVTLLDARTIGITPFDKKMITAVEKAVRESSLGLNPSTQGDTVRIPMPALTEQRRKELAKLAKSDGDGAKVVVRNVRRDANTHLKDELKAKTISEDDEKKAQEFIQKLTDRFVGLIDTAVAEKEKDIAKI